MHRWLLHTFVCSAEAQHVLDWRSQDTSLTCQAASLLESDPYTPVLAATFGTYFGSSPIVHATDTSVLRACKLVTYKHYSYAYLLLHLLLWHLHLLPLRPPPTPSHLLPRQLPRLLPRMLPRLRLRQMRPTLAYVKEDCCIDILGSTQLKFDVKVQLQDLPFPTPPSATSSTATALAHPPLPARRSNSTSNANADREPPCLTHSHSPFFLSHPQPK